MDLHGAGGDHGEGGAAEAQSAGNAPTGEVGGTEDLQGDGEDGEGAHEGGDAAVAKHAAGHRNGDKGPLGTHDTDDGLGDGLGRAGDIHGLGHQGAGEEDEVVVLEEGGKAGHKVDLVRLINIHLAGNGHHQGAGKHRQIDIEALHDHVHQQGKGDNQADDSQSSHEQSSSLSN